MKVTNVAEAERAGRVRATVMALAAVVPVVNAVIEIGSPAYAMAGPRSGLWIVLIGIWLLILVSGGALSRHRDARRLLDDELSLQNRSRAIAFGFYATMLAALGIYVLGWFHPVETHDAVRLITAFGLAAALGRYAWLEFR